MSVSQRGSRSGQSHYVRGLDGLRAIAVAAVVLFHATETSLRGGFLGVDVFFVLSGYLITSQLLGEWRAHARIDLLAFWRRRARRILAALYLLLAVTLTFALFLHPDEVAVFRGDAVAALLYVANWYFVFHHEPYFEAVAHPSPLIHLWSLGVEEQFYLIWPLLLGASLLLLRRWTAALILVIAAASTVLMAILYRPEVDPSRVYYGTDTHAAALLLGSFLAFFWSPGSRQERESSEAGSRWAALRSYARQRLPLDLAGLAVLGALAGFFERSNDSQAFLYRGGFTLVAAITAIGIVALSHPRAGLVTAALEWEPVRWLGTRSYSVYLWHWPVVVFTRPGSGVSATGLPLLALRVTAALVLAELSYRFVEEPVRRGALVNLWRRLEEALWTRQWRWLAVSWMIASASGGLLAALTLAVVAARVPPPPDYLAITSVDTIVRPSAALAEGSGLPSPTATVTAIATQRADQGDSSATPLSSSADTEQPADAPPAPPTAPVSAGRVIAIGDSVMLGAIPQLTQDIDGIQINAAVSRQVSTGIQILSQLRSSGSLGDVVIVDLGSNGEFTDQQFDQIMSALTDVPRVVFVTNRVPRSWEGANNAVIVHGVQRYQNTRLVDWYTVSVNRPEYFQADEYHLRGQGAAAYAALIAAGVAGP